jgi:hypothetical protein
MARKKTRTVDSDAAITLIFLGLFILASLAGIVGQFAHMAGAD